MSDWIQDCSVIGGSTSKSIWVEMRGTDGTAKTGLVYSDITATYTRPGGSNTSVTMATLASITASYSSGGFKEVTNGTYRFDVPDAAIATLSGGGPVLFTFAATGALATNFQLIVNTNNNSASNATQIGSQTASASGTITFPAATLASTTNITAGTIATVTNAIVLPTGTGAGQISLSSGAVLLQPTQTGVTIPTVTTLTNAPGDTSGTTALLGRLTSTRAGYLDNLSAGAVAQASTALSTAVWTGPPTGFLAATFPTAVGTSTYSGADTSGTTTLLSRVTGPVALASGVNATQWAGVNVTGMPMPTYTQPAGFLAATFPATLASTTNIAGGTITTVTNLTNAPTAGDLTATMKASISGLTIARVTLTDTLTTYTGNTLQTGDVGNLIPTRLLMTGGNPWCLDGDGNPIANADDVAAEFATLTAHGDENWEGGGGGGLSGPSSVTLTFQDASNAAVPLVAFTIVGQGVARAGTNGIAAFGLENGSYTVVTSPTSGLVFANTALTVSGTTTLTIHGTAVIIPDAPSANQTSAFLYTFDGGGTLQGSQRIEFQFQVPASGDKGSYYSGSFFALSDATTAQLVVGLEKASGYQARRGTGAWVTFTTGTGSTYALPSILGAP